MRLLIVTSQFPIAGEPNRGRPIYQTVRELSRLAQVRVLSPVATYPRWAQPRSYLYRASDEHHSVPGCDVEYVRYPALPAVSRPFNGRLCARAIAAPLRAFAPDLVLSYWLYPDAYGAMLAARQAEVPLVVGARGSDLRVRDAISRRLTRPVLHAARRLLVVSEDLGRVAERDYGAHPDRIRAIPNGCDASIFHPADRAEARRALDLPADAEVVTYVGRLVPEKGLRELLAAAGALRASRPRLQLVLVGEGPMHGELAALAAAGELPVRFAGTRPPAEVARWMCASDLVTLPSYSEGHPNVLVEALACGRPVVATPVGGIPEVVDAASGVLVPARDPAALAEGLREALERDWDEAALARRFSRDWRQVAQDTLLACEEVLAEARGERALYAAGST
ncbi:MULTISPECIES: glycosyltransferase [unclassified Pseudoxanthomonas]|uniref:glycosyltransferase n=1 Tax=unclassified Pseudoxanthomonas TaxID=2645906 RepID=UPI00160DDB5F|nr:MULTISPECIES: glycosyltransferase [unclassified Pseudoxanthomonas]MBB3277271.1 glycosyltransferase involved in cell wall biosynthesis [Pseudoxanthomonas sp. OG2]MBV7474035.1 glycosyltransferase [Pseudoxanthomonas sp. PXM05]